jgi:threonine dehydrogenase-like Zn-dependent dehydrogenase
MKSRQVKVIGPYKAVIEEVEVPKPRSHEVLIRVRAVGVCRTDLELFSGKYALPVVLGHEVCGVVVEVGDLVGSVEIGDKVVVECTMGCGYCPECISGRYNLCINYRGKWADGILIGAYSDYICVNERAVHKIPESISDVEGALIEPTSVSLRAVKRANVSTGDSVVIIGPGTIGLLSLQAAKALGATQVILIGTPRSEYKLKLGKELGADITVNIEEESAVETVLHVTGRGADAVIIAASNAAKVLDTALDMVKPGGSISIVGLSGGETAPINSDKIVFKDVSIYGCFSSPNVWENAIKLVSNGLVRVKPLITHVLPLVEFEKAFRIVSERKEKVIKVVLKP